MVSSKISSRKPSKTSSLAAPSTSASTQTSSKSSILQSLFSPPELPGCYYASVIQGIDSQHLRIHDATSGQLRCDHAIETRGTVNSLDWGYYGQNNDDRQHAEHRRKRKRAESKHGEDPNRWTGKVVLAFGTSDSYVQFLSIDGEIVGTLNGEHRLGVRDFKFDNLGRSGKGWSIGGDSKIVQWSLHDGRCIKSINAPEPSVSSVFPWNNAILCASQTAYLLKTEGDEEPAPYAASSHKIHSIGLADSSFICASDSERFLNVFAIEEGLTGTLRADADVSSISLYSYPRSIPSEEPGRILSVVNKDGLMEIFQEPFQFSAAGMMGQNLSRKARLSQKSKRSSATLRVRRPDKATSVVPLLDASMRSEFIYLAWAEGGLDVKFEKIRWRASGSYELLLSGSEELVKAESMSGQVNATVNGVKQIGKTYVDESRAVVGDGETIGDVDAPIDRIDSAAAIEISSAEDSESSFESDSEPEPKSSRTTAVEEDVQKEDPDAGALTRKKDDIEEQVVADPVDLAEATFGDLLRAREPALVNVQATFPDPTQQAVARVGAPGSQSSGLSLGLVLSQSLRTNDVSMLESCLHNTDLATIRTTVERLDSSLALVLCQRLAERIHSRPGRAGNLVTWIESIIIAHGGYLVGQPHLMRSIRSLVRVLRERTSALQTFLTMKGKLDIIAAQVNHRRSALERSRAKNALEEDDEEAVIYVEGQDDSSSEDEAGGYEDLTRTSDNDFEPFDDDEDVQMDDEGETVRRLTNGDLSANEDSSDEDEGDGLIDDEAESTDAESDSDLDGDIDDGSVEDSESLASDDEDEAPPAKRPATERLTNGIPHRHS